MTERNPSIAKNKHTNFILIVHSPSFIQVLIIKALGCVISKPWIFFDLLYEKEVDARVRMREEESIFSAL